MKQRRGLKLEHLLRVSISLLIVLATALFSVGDNQTALTLVTLLFVVASAIVTDFGRYFCLSQWMANCAALGIVAVSCINALRLDRHGLLIAVGDLQSYLQYVLLFQPKTPRVYWQLALLSLGQVAIASTLVVGPLFGIMLLLYLIVGLFTFTLLLLQTEGRRSATPAPAVALSRISLRGSAVTALPRAISRGLTQQVLLITFTTAAVSAVLFFLLPRWQIPHQQTASTETVRSVGFSRRVTLGEFGGVVHNSDTVMRIHFYHNQRNNSFRLKNSPLFRGTVVTDYAHGTWTQPSENNLMAVPTNVVPPYVRQKITAEPLDVAALACIFPVSTLRADQRLKLDGDRDELLRQEDTRNQQIEFEVCTDGIRGETQLSYLPSRRSLRPSEVDRLWRMPVGSDGSDPFSGLRETAARVLRERNVSPSDRVAAADAIADHLRRSGQYFYSLNAQARDPRLDPLEDFVTLHRSGHCEYFAGALAMMLRSQEIPARVAIGFKGGEWNPLGKYYEVQQLHAHTWVEVYLAEADIPPSAFADEDMPRAAWYVIDPTEGTREREASAVSLGIWSGIHHYVDYAQVLWGNYVVGLNSKRQRQGIYQPLAAGANATIENVTSAELWRARARWLSNSHLGVFWEWYRRHWFSWRGGLVVVGFLLSLLGLYFGAQGLWRVLRRLGWVRGRSSDDAPVVEFYRRLEFVLGRRGLARQPTQTAFEFALVAGAELSESAEYRRLAHLPRKIVEVFQRVRFGSHALDNQEAEAVEHALVELETALARSR